MQISQTQLNVLYLLSCHFINKCVFGFQFTYNSFHFDNPDKDK